MEELERIKGTDYVPEGFMKVDRNFMRIKNGMGDVDVSEDIENHNTSEFAHQNIQQELADTKSQLNEMASQFGGNDAIIFYVDNLTGSDTNDGLSGSTAYKTIKKCIDNAPKLNRAGVTIRIKIGDYRSEGHIYIRSFWCPIHLIAWNGTQDVTTPKSGLILNGIVAYYNQFLLLSGIEVKNPNASGYGMFLENCNRVRVVGYTNNDATITTNSGVGITQGSNVFMENCLIANKSCVVSCNFGAHVTTKDWHVESINNDLGYSMHGGATGALFDDTLPLSITMFQQIEGGLIVDKSGNKIFAKRAQRIYVNRDASVTTDWTIALTLSSKPSIITAISVVAGTKVAGNSQYVDGQTFSTSTNSDGINTVSYDFIYLQTSAGNAVKYTIKELTKDKIVLGCVPSGSPTGTVGISMILQV